MRVLIQRTTAASVVIEGKINGQIEKGLVLLVGICAEDTVEDIDWLVQKIASMRIFTDEEGKMNLSVQEIGGAFLVISQFTLFASTKKGNRPGFTNSAKPEVAVPLYEEFIRRLKSTGIKVETGIFGADMKVQLINDGPVTIWLDSKNKE